VPAVALAAVALAIGAGAASAAEPRTTLPDVEDEVMCVQCKTPLNLSTAAVAEREREFIRGEIAKGRTKGQIKDSLVQQFGPTVLAVPEPKGFGLTAWVVPIIAALLALAGVVIAARRWRRPAPAAEAPAEPEIDAADAWRLERELSVYDRKGKTPRA
jgi:cytochrome c-type biogenesis protein CcmH/NrfF